jgi:hypothetical protein
MLKVWPADLVLLFFLIGVRRCLKILRAFD